MKKIWILAGEASGDLYGARLADALRRRDPSIVVQGMGGTAMRAANVDILVDSTELGVVGFIEVLKHYPMFRRIFNNLVARARNDRPDVVVPIDYPGFNLRFAEQMKGLNIDVVYYISPQVWAWGTGRIPKIARIVRKMLVIFPFEKEVYRDVGLDTTFVGHPLVDIMADQRDESLQRDDHLIVLLPGSRFSEVERLLCPILQAAQRLYDTDNRYRFVLAAPREAIAEYARNAIATRTTNGRSAPIEIVVGETEVWMQRATAGIAASGTVTVQSAIAGLPLVVVYRVNPLTFFLGRMLVDIDHITMVNLVAEREVFEEYLQGQVQPTIIADAVTRIVPGGERRDDVLAGMTETVKRLTSGTDASANAADAILSVLNDTPNDAATSA